MDKAFYDDLMSKAGAEKINRYVVGAIIMNDSKVLLLQRPKNDFLGGIYELPSGKVETEESLDTALLREVEEETGLSILKIIKYIGHFDYESKSGKKTRQFNFAVSINLPLEIGLTEHDNYAWSKKDELDKYQITDSVKEVLSNYWNQDV